MTPTTYPTARRVLASKRVEGAKRKRLLASIAAFQDEGVDPSVRHLCRRAKLKPIEGGGGKQRQAVLAIDRLLDALARDGFLRVERTDHQRNRYEVLLDAL